MTRGKLLWVPIEAELWTGGRGLRDPTAAELRDHLQAHPALALEVLDGLRVARPWWSPEEAPVRARSSHRFRWASHESDPSIALASDADPPGHVYPQYRQTAPWRGAACGIDLPGEWPTAEEAMAAVDQILRDAGWGLA